MHKANAELESCTLASLLFMHVQECLTTTYQQILHIFNCLQLLQQCRAECCSDQLTG